jgi:biopolymer transport protein ExbD
MALTPRQRRAERKARHENAVDMNLVSLIDVFTILIFFLLSNSGGVEALATPKAVKLPESVSTQEPKDTVVVVVSATDIVVNGRKVAAVADVIDQATDVVAPLKTELDALASREVIRQENAEKARRLTILGDKEIPYRLLRKIMATSAVANFGDVSFAVRPRSGA